MNGKTEKRKILRRWKRHEYLLLCVKSAIAKYKVIVMKTCAMYE